MPCTTFTPDHTASQPHRRTGHGSSACLLAHQHQHAAPARSSRTTCFAPALLSAPPSFPRARACMWASRCAPAPAVRTGGGEAPLLLLCSAPSCSAASWCCHCQPPRRGLLAKARRRAAAALFSFSDPHRTHLILPSLLDGDCFFSSPSFRNADDADRHHQKDRHNNKPNKKKKPASYNY